MRCNKCPLLSSLNTESGWDEQCGLFGNWSNCLQYEKAGEIIGCYVDRHYIKKLDAEIWKHYAEMAARDESEVYT